MYLLNFKGLPLMTPRQIRDFLRGYILYKQGSLEFINKFSDKIIENL